MFGRERRHPRTVGGRAVMCNVRGHLVGNLRVLENCIQFLRMAKKRLERGSDCRKKDREWWEIGNKWGGGLLNFGGVAVVTLNL